MTQHIHISIYAERDMQAYRWNFSEFFCKEDLSSVGVLVTGCVRPHKVAVKLRALAAVSQQFSLSLGIQTTFCFPIQIHTIIDSLNHSLYH